MPVFHPFHMVTVSPWPLYISLALFNLAMGAVGYFNGLALSGSVLLFALGTVVLIMALWLRDVVSEGTYLGDHTSDVVRGIGFGVTLFIVTEIMVFVSIFWGYFHAALSPAVEVGVSWPSAGIAAIDPFALPLLNTVLLLSSGAAVTYAHHGLVAGDRGAALVGMGLTLALAAVFTLCQGIEYATAGFTMQDGVYGTVFYASTGAHGFHVILGTLFLLVGAVRLAAYHLTTAHHMGLQFAIVYWHFVDIVWLILFVVVYGFSADA
jgi:cytochrome c oxidase subunit 3